MEFGAVKPFLTGLILPPTLLILLALLGLLMASRQKRGGLALAGMSVVLLAVLSCHGTAVWLARTALPSVAPLSLADLKASGAQAIVVLGGDLLPEAPEYGEPQPGPQSAARLRYGIWLSRQSGLPLAFSGGLGWAADERIAAPEAKVAARVALQDYGVTLRWVEAKSRDTGENARLLAPLLQRNGIRRIALVTHAWHMPRAAAAFAKAGFTVSAAPTGFVLRERLPALEWLPSASGLQASQSVLREYAALAVERWRPT